MITHEKSLFFFFKNRKPFFLLKDKFALRCFSSRFQEKIRVPLHSLLLLWNRSLGERTQTFSWGSLGFSDESSKIFRSLSQFSILQGERLNRFWRMRCRFKANSLCFNYWYLRIFCHFLYFLQNDVSMVCRSSAGAGQTPQARCWSLDAIPLFVSVSQKFLLTFSHTSYKSNNRLFPIPSQFIPFSVDIKSLRFHQEPRVSPPHGGGYFSVGFFTETSKRNGSKKNIKRRLIEWLLIVLN